MGKGVFIQWKAGVWEVDGGIGLSSSDVRVSGKLMGKGAFIQWNTGVWEVGVGMGLLSSDVRVSGKSVWEWGLHPMMYAS